MNPVLLDLGIVKIYWYSIMILMAFLVGGTLAIKEGGKWKINEDFMINYFFFLVPISLLGARLYYVLFSFSGYEGNLLDIFKVWEGGLAIHGGIIFGLLWTIFYTKKNKINPLRLLDIAVVSLAIGQAIGRWGNFFNQEAYGGVVEKSFLEGLRLPEFIIDNMYILGEYRHPTFLYESIGTLLIFLALLLIRNFSKYLKIGHLTSYYLIFYGILRFFIEGMRTDSLMFNDLRVAQLVSIAMVVIGVLFNLYLRKGSRFDNLYKEQEEI